MTYLDVGLIVYGLITYCAVAGIVIERHDAAHWTRPFAGFLWPLLAVYALWRVVFREGRADG